MNDAVQSAIQNVNPAGPGRGRAPVTLRGGKLLSEARAEAKQAHVDAKNGYKNAKAALKDADRNEKSAYATAARAEKELTKAKTGKPLPDKAQQKQRIADLTAAHKSANAAHKDAVKASSAALKAADKAQAAIVKAETARNKVEEQNTARKAKVN